MSRPSFVSVRAAAVLCALAACLLLLSGCCGSGRYVPEPGETVPDALEFFDSMTFDRALARSLGVRHEEVEVTFPARVSLNSLPERFDKWLAAVEEYGGRVRAAPEVYDERGFLEEIFSFFVRVYEHIAGVCLYAPARGYDALILYDEPTGMVTRVLFLLRPGPEESPAESSAPPAGPAQEARP